MTKFHRRNCELNAAENPASLFMEGRAFLMTDEELKIHEGYMRRALELAIKGAGRVNPNPLVGSVVVKDGRVVSEDYHHEIGGFHAERNALMHCRDEDAVGADLYVTLEPCCHTGKTPPCTDIIIEKKIRRVFVGAGDPNPKVAGKGIRILRDHGIEVFTGILEQECLDINAVFFHYITTGTPYVISKFAETLDGKIATVAGDSKWITSEEARRRTHEDRNRYSAILVGIGTVLADDPLLTTRLSKGQQEALDGFAGRNPIRIVCDSHLSIPLDSKIVKTAKEEKTIVACVKSEHGDNCESGDSFDHSEECKHGNSCESNALPERGDASQAFGTKKEALRAAGAEVLEIPALDGHVDLSYLMAELGRREIDSVLIEGGGEIHAAAFAAGLVNAVQAYIDPKIVGGCSAKSPVGGLGIASLSDAVQLSVKKVERLGPDILVTADVQGSKR